MEQQVTYSARLYQRCPLVIIHPPSESYCRAPTAPANGRIFNYSSTVEGSQIAFHCGGDSPMMTSTCTDGSWIPDPADLDCGSLPPG